MKHFGTDGIRRLAEEFTEKYLLQIADGIAALPHCGRVIIGRDPRTSGRRMENTLSEALKERGAEVIRVGMLPTPALSYLTVFYKADYGIMLSASHNPPEYNGVKLFASDGSKVGDDIEEAVERGMEIPFVSDKTGNVKNVNGEEAYISYLIDAVKPDLRGLRVALDASNGAASLIAPEVFRRAGAEVTAFNTDVSGELINKNCGATDVTFLTSVADGFDIAFAYDGDGDRVMCSQGGKLLNGDHIMYAHCKALLKQGKLAKNTMVGTVMSNMGTEIACLNAGIKLVRTAVGDKNVYREMRAHGYNVGGEESGHVIFSDYMPTGDGILTSLLTAVLNKAAPLSELDDIEERPAAKMSVRTGKGGAEKFYKDEVIAEVLASVDDGYRYVVRPRGTEPIIRILVEARDGERAEAKALQIKKLIEERLL